MHSSKLLWGASGQGTENEPPPITHRETRIRRPLLLMPVLKFSAVRCRGQGIHIQRRTHGGQKRPDNIVLRDRPRACLQPVV